MEVGGREDWGVGEGRRRRVRRGTGAYHDITPLLSRYVSERRSFSSTSEAARWCRGGGNGGAWGVGVQEVEFLCDGWGVDFRVGEPHVIRVRPSGELNEVP